MIEYWPEGHKKSTDNYFNVPPAKKIEKTKRDYSRPTKERAKKYRPTKKELSMIALEEPEEKKERLFFLAELQHLARDSINTETMKQSDRTQSIMKGGI